MMFIAVLNHSTVCKDIDVAAWSVAVNLQVNRDFAPMWGVSAPVIFCPASSPVPEADAWQMIILDDADQASALGYHDLTKDGMPLGKVFARTTLNYGDQVSVVLSHEVLEMLADPMINQSILLNGKRYAIEVADPVEDDSIGYQIGGVLVSDFVSRRYFDGVSPGPLDFRNYLTAGCPALEPGGYISYENADGSWSQTFGAKIPTAKALMKMRPLLGSRRYRRYQLPREQWLCSII